MASSAGRDMFGGSNRNYDPLLPMLLVSVILHMTGLVGLAVYEKYWVRSEPVKINPDNYVVHLIDPGETPGEPGVGKSAIVDAAPPVPTLKKSAPVEKVLIPVSKESGGEIKKIAVAKKVEDVKKIESHEPEPAKQLKVKSEAPPQKSDSVAKEVKTRKGGGNVDIAKFPYEWYLRVMETRVYGNWDVLKVNMAASKAVKVVVMFSIDRNGKVVKMDVEQSSYDDNIDRSAKEAVMQSAPFPPLPPSYKDDTLDVHFGFTINASK
jgi:TonB family protein